MTTEAQLLMTLRDSLQHIKGMQTPSDYVQEQVKTHGAPIVKALQQERGNISKAAKQLGLGRTTLIEKMRKHGLQYERLKEGIT